MIKKRKKRGAVRERDPIKAKYNKMRYQAILMLVVGIVIGILIDFLLYGLASNDFTFNPARPPSALSISIILVSVVLSLSKFQSAYSFYLYAKIVEQFKKIESTQVQRPPPAMERPAPIIPSERPVQPPTPQLPSPVKVHPPEVAPPQPTPPVAVTKETVREYPRPQLTGVETTPTPPQPSTPKPSPPVSKPSKKTCPFCGRELPFGDIHVICPYCGRRLK